MNICSQLISFYYFWAFVKRQYTVPTFVNNSRDYLNVFEIREVRLILNLVLIGVQ